MPPTPVVFVHGWAGSADAWSPIVDRLHADGSSGDLIAVRLPSSPGAAPGLASTIPSAVDVVVEALGTLGAPAVLVGHSMGAQITLLAQCAAPEFVVGELVIDPAYGADDDAAPEMAAWANRIEAHGHVELSEFFRVAATGVSDDDLARLMSDLHATSPSAIASYLRSEYVDRIAIGRLAQTRLAAARRSRPVLALHTSERGASLEEGFASPPGSRVERWPGLGHFAHLIEPDRFVDTLRSWRSDLLLESVVQ